MYDAPGLRAEQMRAIARVRLIADQAGNIGRLREDAFALGLAAHALVGGDLRDAWARLDRVSLPEAAERIRTADPFITSEVLYQLSYGGGAAECSHPRVPEPAAVSAGV